MKNLTKILLIPLFVGAALFGAEKSNNARPPKKLTIAILPFQDRLTDTKTTHWQVSLHELVGRQLGAAHSCFRVLSGSSVDFGFRQSALERGQALTIEQARRVGKSIEADYVFWGDFGQTAGKPHLNAQIVRSDGGLVGEPLSISSTNWLSVGLEAVNWIILRTGVNPTAEERRRVLQAPAHSPEAFELMFRAFFDARSGAGITAAETEARQALSIEPTSAPGWLVFATLLVHEGDLEGALEAAKKAVALDDGSARSHELLASIYYSQQLYLSAQEELTISARLDPDRAETYVRLGEISAVRDKMEEAASYFKKAAELAPYEAAPHAELGRVAAETGDRQLAMAELRVAEKLTSADDPSNDALLAEGFRRLNAIPDAVDHYERYIAYLDRIGARPADYEDRLATLKSLRARLTPHFVTVEAPRFYTSNELATILKAKLAPQEFAVATNPLISTPEMERWAKQAVGDAGDDMEKVKRLFSLLTRRVHITGQIDRRTAPGVFKAWPDVKAEFTCEDYAFLYIVLARAVGLKTCFAEVSRDCEGALRLHACACVCFPDGKGLLIDPAYLWLGVPHQEFTLRTDLEVISLYLAESEDLVRMKIATTAAPDLQMVHFDLAFGLAKQGRLDEARHELEAGLKLSPGTWLSLYSEGVIEGYETKWPNALTHLQQSLAINPDFSQTRFYMGSALWAQGRPEEARAAYRIALQGDLPTEYAVEARDAITKINEMLLGQ